MEKEEETEVTVFFNELMWGGGEAERGGFFPVHRELWREMEKLLFNMSYWGKEKRWVEEVSVLFQMTFGEEKGEVPVLFNMDHVEIAEEKVGSVGIALFRMSLWRGRRKQRLLSCST